MFPDPVTGELTQGIAKVRYSHAAMIDMIVAQPNLKQNDLAAYFDRSPTWVSNIINSDAFQASLARRKEEVENPTLIATVNERLRALADVSLARILERVGGPMGQFTSDDFLIKSAKLSVDALGYGARPTGPSVNVAVVIQVPQKAPTPAAWVEAHSPIREAA